MLISVLAIILSIFCFIALRFLLELIKIRKARKSSATEYLPKWHKPVSAMVVLGSGGHTKEMLALIQSLPTSVFLPRHFIIAKTDKFSMDKVSELHSELESDNYTITSIPRSREVNQSYLSSIWTTLYSAFYTLPVVICYRPKVLLCNGPGTCIPVCFWLFMMKVLFLSDCKIVFIESICRVKSLSLSGRILYYIADFFLVQWPELQTNFPLTTYIGRLL